MVGGILIGVAVLLVIAAVVFFVMAMGANQDADDAEALRATLADQEAAAKASIDPAMGDKLNQVATELENMWRASNAAVEAENGLTASFDMATRLYNAGDTAGADAVVTQTLPGQLGASTDKLNAETSVAGSLRKAINEAEGS